MVYKLSDNFLSQAPKSLIYKGILINNPSDEFLKTLGYKELIVEDTPEIKWFQRIETMYIEGDHTILETKTVFPIYNLKADYIKKVNSTCDMQIAATFVFTDDLGNMHKV